MTTEEQILAFVNRHFGKRTWREVAGKLLEESGEVAGVLVKIQEGRKTLDDLRDEIGDMMIVLSQLAALHGYVLDEIPEAGDKGDAAFSIDHLAMNAACELGVAVGHLISAIRLVEVGPSPADSPQPANTREAVAKVLSILQGIAGRCGPNMSLGMLRERRFVEIVNRGQSASVAGVSRTSPGDPGIGIRDSGFSPVLVKQEEQAPAAPVLVKACESVLHVFGGEPVKSFNEAQEVANYFEVYLLGEFQEEDE